MISRNVAYTQNFAFERRRSSSRLGASAAPTPRLQTHHLCAYRSVFFCLIAAIAAVPSYMTQRTMPAVALHDLYIHGVIRMAEQYLDANHG